MPRLPLAAAALALAAGAAAAQAPTLGDSARRDSARRALPPVTVTGARTPAVVGGAGAVTVRPGALPLPTLPAPPLDQVLRQTPFVLVRQNSRGEAELSVRGSDSRQAAVLLDGLPLTLGWDHRADPSLVPTTGVSRLTLVRGLGSLLAGPNTLGGVIALDLNAPPDRGPDGAARPAAAAGTGVDQYAGRVGTLSVAAPVLAGRAGTLVVRAGGTARRRDGVALSRQTDAADGLTGGAADPGDPRDTSLRTNTDLRQTDGYAAARFDAPGGAYAGLTALAYRARRGVAPEQHVAAPRFWRYPEATRRLGVLAAGTGARRTPLGTGRADVSAGAYQGRTAIDVYATRAFDTVTSRELGDERTATARLTAAHSLPLGGELRAGGTLAQVRYDETLDAQRPDARATRYRQRLSSAGAEAEWPVLGRARVSAGWVRDAARTPESGYRPPLGRVARGGWRVGATAAATPAVQLHASASRRARFPALRELYSGALNRFEPNPALRPERLLGVEGGATLVGGAAQRAGLDLQAVVFRHRLDDAVVRTTLPNRRFYRVNRDQIRSTGLELLAGWTPRRATPAGDPAGVSVTGDLTAQRVRVRDRTLAAGLPNERRPEHVPGLRGSLDVGVPLGWGVRASALGRYAGRQYCQHPDLGRQVALGAQAAGDAAVSRAWALGRGALGLLRATLALDNVTDATVYDQCGLPQPGRTLRVGVEVR